MSFKIALIDNMNNAFFSFARYLRRAGVDVDLFCINYPGMEHFKPEADTYLPQESLTFVKDFPVLTNLDGWRQVRHSAKIFDFLKSYDLIIACGRSVAFLESFNIRVDIFFVYGSDLYRDPFWYFNWRNPIRSLQYMEIAKFQARGIKKARLIISTQQQPLYRKAMEKLEVTCIDSGFPFLFIETPPANNDANIIWSFLRSHDFVVFNHSRHIWSSNPDNFVDFNENGGNKRNDKTIKAFANFLKQTKFKSPVLVLFEYGEDVGASKKLIDELGIAEWVKWMPKSNRKHILIGLRMASLAVNQVRRNICGVGVSAYEIMSLGVPCITHMDGALQDANSPYYSAPIIDVLTEEDILNVFIDFEQNQQKYKDIGICSKQWFEDRLGQGLARRFIELINLMALNKNFNQYDNTADILRILMPSKGHLND